MSAFIRRALPADAPAIAAVHVQSWLESYRGLMPDALLDGLDVAAREARWQAELAKPQHHVWVAEQAGQVVGFADCGPVRGAEVVLQGEIYAIYLLKAAQGLGMGRGLFEACLADLRALGLNSLLVWVLAGNRTADFYAHLGGVPMREEVVQHSGHQLAHIGYGWRQI